MMSHSHSHSHASSQDVVGDSNDRGMWALKVSLLGLLATAVLQVALVIFTHSVALLADTIHNIGDALTALPLGVAFYLGKRPSTSRFTYGLSRSEDIAGMLIVTLILVSAIAAGYESVNYLIYPRAPTHLLFVFLGGLIGFVGNEAVAIFRIRVGKEIGSAALVADGKHARVDGLASLAVVVGAVGVVLGFPMADPIVGLFITILILRIVWHTARDVGLRALDAIEPEIVDQTRDVAAKVTGVLAVGQIRARWVGHKVNAELDVAVDSTLTVAQGHEIAEAVRRVLLRQVPHLGAVIVHIDPIEGASGRFDRL